MFVSKRVTRLLPLSFLRRFDIQRTAYRTAYYVLYEVNIVQNNKHACYF